MLAGGAGSWGGISLWKLILGSSSIDGTTTKLLACDGMIISKVTVDVYDAAEETMLQPFLASSSIIGTEAGGPSAAVGVLFFLFGSIAP
jgi:hypothetical protein